ncbi:MAG: glycosyltransferase family 47 protein [Actinomycetota bacterium]|nr:glycosyltransferase family 47 protein [Actinomycetota bacterium]
MTSLRLSDYRALYLFSQADHPIPWAPGVFASLPHHRARAHFAGGFYALPGYFEDPAGSSALIEGISTEPDLLWSFVGSISTYPSVRAQLLRLRDDRGLAVNSATWGEVRWKAAGQGALDRRDAIKSYVASLARSKFVLAPRGVGASSVRLFEAMQAGRVPVIISDDWLPPALVDWGNCSIRVPESDISSIPMILREREADARCLGDRARYEWESNFSPRTMAHHLVRSCLQLHAESPRLGRRLRLSGATLPTRPTVHRLREVADSEWSRYRDNSRKVS